MDAKQVKAMFEAKDLAKQRQRERIPESCPDELIRKIDEVVRDVKRRMS